MEIPDIPTLISYLNSYQLKEIVLAFQIPFLFFSSVLFILIIVLIFRTSWMQYAFWENLVQFFTFKPYGIKKSVKAWVKIAKKLESRDEAEYKLAIIEADKMLDSVLKQVGYSGETLEEKIKKLSQFLISNKEEVLEVHRYINDLLYNPNYRLELDAAKDYLEVYKKALVDLGVL